MWRAALANSFWWKYSSRGRRRPGRPPSLL